MNCILLIAAIREYYFSILEPTRKSLKPLNPLKGTLKSSLVFSEFPYRGQG
jgi:hypothetical protein